MIVSDTVAVCDSFVPLQPASVTTNSLSFIFSSPGVATSVVLCSRAIERISSVRSELSVLRGLGLVKCQDALTLRVFECLGKYLKTISVTPSSIPPLARLRARASARNSRRSREPQSHDATGICCRRRSGAPQHCPIRVGTGRPCGRNFCYNACARRRLSSSVGRGHCDSVARRKWS